MATDPPGDLVLTTSDGVSHTLAEWLTTFNLAVVVIDPYANESAWILDTSARIMREFTGAGVRLGWLVTGDADAAKRFLGPLEAEFLTLCDADRAAVRALGLSALPAWVLVLMDGTVQAAVEGWQPLEWRAMAKQVAAVTSWTYPLIPAASDPQPFAGAPALG